MGAAFYDAAVLRGLEPMTLWLGVRVNVLTIRPWLPEDQVLTQVLTRFALCPGVVEI